MSHTDVETIENLTVLLSSISKAVTSDAVRAAQWYANLVYAVDFGHLVSPITLHALDASLEHFEHFVTSGDPEALAKTETMIEQVLGGGK